MSTDANTELLITGKQFNDMWEKLTSKERNEMVRVYEARNSIRCLAPQYVAVYNPFYKEDSDYIRFDALICDTEDTRTIPDSALISFVDNPMNGALNGITKFIREHLQPDSPVFDDKLAHWSSGSLVSDSFGVGKANVRTRDLFNALELYNRKAALNVEQCISDIQNSETPIMKYEDAIDTARMRGLDIPNEGPLTKVSDCLILTDAGKVYRHPDEITHSDFVLNSVLHIANGSVKGPTLGDGHYDTTSLVKVVAQYLDFEKLTMESPKSRNRPS